MRHHQRDGQGERPRRCGSRTRERAQLACADTLVITEADRVWIGTLGVGVYSKNVEDRILRSPSLKDKKKNNSHKEDQKRVAKRRRRAQGGYCLGAKNEKALKSSI